jgi:hypothetical protein
VIKPIVMMFSGDMTINYEGSSESLELVIHALEEVVMYVVVAKKDNFDQAKAQLMIQLHGN